MKTPEQRESDFLCDLRDLLTRHNAEMTVTDDGRGYGMASPLCEIYLRGAWDQDGKIIEKTHSFQVPVYMRGTDRG